MTEIQSFQQPQQKKQKLDVLDWFFAQSLFVKSAAFAVVALLLISPILLDNSFQPNLTQQAASPQRPLVNSSDIPLPTHQAFQYDCLLNTHQQCSANSCASYGTTSGVGKCPKYQSYCCTKR